MHEGCEGVYRLIIVVCCLGVLNVIWSYTERLKFVQNIIKKGLVCVVD